MSTVTPQPENPTTPIDSPRATFNDEVFNRGIKFAEALLHDVPELEGVAVLPSWSIPQDHLPVGLVIGRSGPLRSPAEIMHMAMQLHSCMKQQLDNLLRVLSVINTKAAELATEITARRKEIHDLDAELASRRKQP